MQYLQWHIYNKNWMMMRTHGVSWTLEVEEHLANEDTPASSRVSILHFGKPRLNCRPVFFPSQQQFGGVASLHVLNNNKHISVNTGSVVCNQRHIFMKLWELYMLVDWTPFDSDCSISKSTCTISKHNHRIKVVQGQHYYYFVLLGNSVKLWC